MWKLEICHSTADDSLSKMYTHLIQTTKDKNKENGDIYRLENNSLIEKDLDVYIDNQLRILRKLTE